MQTSPYNDNFIFDQAYFRNPICSIRYWVKNPFKKDKFKTSVNECCKNA